MSAQSAASCTQATFASTGHVIMSSGSAHTHFSRAALSAIHFFKLQGKYTNWRIDGQKFLEAFEHKDKDGRWISEGEWDLGPCSGREPERKLAFERWAKIVSKAEKFIPRIASKGGGDAVNAILSGNQDKSKHHTAKKERKRKPAKCKFCGSINYITERCGKSWSYLC